MMLLLLGLVLGGIGHAVVWTALVNRIHGLGLERRWIDLLTILCGVALVAIPIAIAAALFAFADSPAVRVGRGAAWLYLAASSVACVAALLQRLRFAWHPERYGTLIGNHTTHINLRNETRAPLAAPGISDWLSRLPGNQVFEVRLQEKHLALPRLTAQHEGLRLAHLSDLHMSGRITKVYFERIVEHVNRCEPDLVAITGDLVERDACLDWIPDTLGRLRARAGVYYVLGNHDRHVEESRIHAALADAGLIYLGGQWRQITIGGTPVILAGNEMPWYGPAADLSGCPARDSAGLPLRIVLAHSPDQFGWAQEHDVDLMLAGHNHGGQVRFPILGPVLAPSLHGVRYAAGAFRAGNTVMHVSRGTACLTPVRYNCPAEIALLVLRAQT